MEITRTAIPDVLLITPKVFGDDRGFFMESWNQKAFDEAVGHEIFFVQDNHSRSTRGVLRGLHYQEAPHAQGKLVRVSQGEVFDVAVDIREGSPTFGKHVSAVLSGDNKQMLWIPEGFAHGFLVLTDSADVHYKATDYYCQAAERGVFWSDPELGINWPISNASEALLSAKDSLNEAFSEVARV